MSSSTQPSGDAAPALPGDGEIFGIAPPHLIQKTLGTSSHRAARNVRLALFVVLIGWMPLPLLVLVHDMTHGLNNLAAFAGDAGAHARFLVASPLFIAAEILCARRLDIIAQYLGASGLVAAAQRRCFDDLIALTRARLMSAPAKYAIVAFAFAVVLTLAVFTRPDEIPQWQRLDRNHYSPTPAGWWHVLVSLPLFTALLLAWLWRLCAWTRFLSAAARLDLQIVPAHPDKSGGLAFVGYSLRAFAIVGAAMLAVVAGRVANEVLHRGASLYDERYVIAVAVAVVTVFFVAPLFVLTPALVKAWRSGILSYGALAGDVGRQLEGRWLRADSTPKDALASPDFSAAADLYQSVSNVYQMRLVPLELKSLAVLIVSLLLPFVPVLFLTVPLSKIVSVIKSLLM